MQNCAKQINNINVKKMLTACMFGIFNKLNKDG